MNQPYALDEDTQNNPNRFLLWSEHTAELLQQQRFNPKARLVHDILPLGTFRWTDELSEEWGTLSIVNFRDRSLVSRLFEIRDQFWETGVMIDADEFFWEDAKRRFPDWPIFQRLHISDELKAGMALERESR